MQSVHNNFLDLKFGPIIAVIAFGLSMSQIDMQMMLSCLFQMLCRELHRLTRTVSWPTKFFHSQHLHKRDIKYWRRTLFEISEELIKQLLLELSPLSACKSEAAVRHTYEMFITGIFRMILMHKLHYNWHVHVRFWWRFLYNELKGIHLNHWKVYLRWWRRDFTSALGRFSSSQSPLSKDLAQPCQETARLQTMKSYDQCSTNSQNGLRRM